MSVHPQAQAYLDIRYQNKFAMDKGNFAQTRIVRHEFVPSQERPLFWCWWLDLGIFGSYAVFGVDELVAGRKLSFVADTCSEDQ